jgi:hypothetical protein
MRLVNKPAQLAQGPAAANNNQTYLMFEGMAARVSG